MYTDEKTRTDKELVKQCSIEGNFWYQVHRRLVDIIFILASENLAFRGHREVREEVNIEAEVILSACSTNWTL